MEVENKSLRKSAANAQNHGGKAINSYVAYNVKHKTKENVYQQHGLTGKDTARDVGRVMMITQQVDLEKCNSLNDNTKDYPGIFCSHLLGGDIDAEKGKDSIAVRVIMFSRSNIELFHTLAKTERACVNYDSTGSEVECNIDTNEGE